MLTLATTSRVASGQIRTVPGHGIDRPLRPRHQARFRVSREARGKCTNITNYAVMFVMFVVFVMFTRAGTH